MITETKLQNFLPSISNDIKKISPARAKARILLFLSTKKMNRKDKSPVVCRITLAGKRAELSTGISLTRKEWDSGRINMEIKSDTESYRAQLGLMKTRILQIETDLVLQGKGLSSNAIKKQLFSAVPVFPSFMECFSKFLERQESLIDIDFGQRTYNSKVAHCKLFRDFLKIKYQRLDIEITDMREKIVDEFYVYCKTTKKLSNNYFCKILFLYKSVLNYAVTQEYIHTNFLAGYKVKKDKNKEIKSLSINEVKILQEKNFASVPLQKTKDCFLFQCYTGLAYVDLYNLKREHIHLDTGGKYWILINRQKSSIKATIPILPEAMEILNRYSNINDLDIEVKNNGVLPVYSNQIMNRFLKEIALLTGIDAKLMSTHTARKTFGTSILNQSTISIETVAAMLGHSKTSTTQKYYAKVQQHKIAREMEGFNYLKLD
ncbi:MAG: tyrosine-type recombinase/integrase [Bacteroidota bacterium]